MADYHTILPYENVNDKIILKVTVKGQAYRFLLDTGAPTSISHKVFEAAKPDIITSISISDANGAKDSIAVVSLDDLALNEIVFNNTPTLLIKSNPAFECFEIDGIIGSNLLRNSILQIDESKKQVIITNDKKRLGLKSQKPLDMFLDNQSSPIIWIELKNKKKAKEQLLFDSGMGGFYDLSMRNLNIFQEKNIFEVKGKGIGSNAMGLHGIAKDAIIYRLLLPEMKINETTFKNISIETTLGNNSRIGAELIHYGIVTVDYKNKKFYFTPYAGTEIDISEKKFPVSFVPNNNKMLVSTVWDSSLYEKISSGDQVISIDGVNYENVSICDLILKSILEGKDNINLKTKNKAGEVIETLIERK